MLFHHEKRCVTTYQHSELEYIVDYAIPFNVTKQAYLALLIFSRRFRISLYLLHAGDAPPLTYSNTSLPFNYLLFGFSTKKPVSFFFGYMHINPSHFLSIYNYNIMVYLCRHEQQIDYFNND